jgi:HAE1 family hydrophobic/amphiphilic exporter-1
LRIISTWPAGLRPTPVGDLRQIDLATAVAEALERSGVVRAAIANRAAIEAKIRVVASTLWPQINATGKAYRYETGKSISPMTALDEIAYSGDLTVSQSLFSFGRIPAALRAAYAERAAADAGVVEAKNSVRFRVEAAFLGRLLARERTVVAREALEVGEALLLRARAREAAGVGTRFDVMRAEAERAAALARIVEEEARSSTARELLAVAMGLTPSAPVDALGVLGSTAHPVVPERALELFERHRPDLAIMRHRIESSEALARYERSQSLPSLDLFASANYTRHDYIRPPNFSPWRDGSNALAGVAVTVPIFDGFRARNAARAQDAATRGLAAGFEEARHAALLELRSVYYDLGAASERIAARRAGLKAAEEALRMAELSFAAGRAAALDVIQSSYVLADARRGEAEARHDYHLGLCRLVRVTGAPEAVEGMGLGK